MFRFADAAKTIIEDLTNPGRFIPNDPRNAHYRELVELWVRQGNTIAPFVPDPAAEAAARRAKLREQLLDALLDDASAGKTLDQIRTDIKREPVILDGKATA
jgi:hypothetical protein